MKQEYYTILPTKDKALNYIEKFGCEKLRYKTFSEALQHYDELKRIQIPDIGIAKVTCINGAELLKERREGKMFETDFVENEVIENEEINI